MFCNHCGAPYPAVSKFCPNCGRPLTTIEKEIVLPQPLALPLSMQPSPPAPHAEPTQRPAMAPPAPVKKGSLRVPIAILAILCVVGLIVFALFPGDTGGASPQAVGKENYFMIDGGCLTFDESFYNGSEELTVPETVDGETVTCICDWCFYNCNSLTTVKLPDTLKSIGFRAFYNCDSLRGILIPEGVQHIDGKAFADCDALEAVTIPGTIESLAEDAFEGCDRLWYVFFSGTMEEWTDLFEGQLHPKATVYCSDGEI